MEHNASDVVRAASLLGKSDQRFTDRGWLGLRGGNRRNLLRLQVAGKAIGGEQQNIVDLKFSGKEIRLDRIVRADGSRDDRLQS